MSWLSTATVVDSFILGCRQIIEFSRSQILLVHHQLIHRVLQLFGILENYSISNQVDKREWRWEAKGDFSVRSYFHILNVNGILVPYANLLGSVPIPLKVKILRWLVIMGKLNTKVVLACKEVTIDAECVFCMKQE